MADAPEKILRRTLAQLLDDWDLATYAPTGALPENGVKVTRPMPTTVNGFTMLTSPPPTADGGRADVLYRVQFYTRRANTGDKLDSPDLVEAWASALFARLDQKEYLPQVLGISWAWEYSRLYFDPDTQGRAAVACNYAFRGRRP